MFDLEKIMVVCMILVFFTVLCFGVLVEENRKLRRKVEHYEVYRNFQSGEKK